ncbi:hypothetical protein HELRODRAFT_83154, partial [Helobdella robusta]|uniref:Cadherin domain-containing protein n=1 Tax=Helobdella robusta TaxID=6412 RepID=T1G512_HELRO
YSFTITAYDNGTPRLNGSANIHVFLTNVNDLAPTFSNPMEYVQVSEDAVVGTLIHVIQAYDVDGDSVAYNGLLSWGPFSIASDTGVIMLRGSLDKSSSLSYRLNITATDDGICCGGVITRSMVVVEIKDVNNNAPKFLECSSYNPVVMEKENIGTPVIQVSATDYDTGINSNITYSLVRFAEQSSFDRFDIDPRTGLITTSDILDRESKIGITDYGLTVKAEDHGSPSLAGFCSFQVKVGDKNDNAPSFNMPEYFVSVEESSSVGKKIKQVYATDQDAGRNMGQEATVKSLMKDYKKFTINSTTGTIRTSAMFDREIKKEYYITVVAQDGAPSSRSNHQPPATATATVLVEDINDQVPRFKQKFYEISIFESRPTGTNVLTVFAYDDDVGVNAKLIYSLVKLEDHKYFRIFTDAVSNSGVIQIHNEIDFETIKLKYFNLTVGVHDLNPLHNDTAYILINILDANDNAPTFSITQHKINVFENISVDSSLFRFVVHDLDTGQGGLFRYEIDPLSDPQNNFKISDSGLVSTAQSLDRENRAEHKLRVMAIDQGVPQLTGYATLYVTLKDVNDNPPHLNITYLPIIYENKPPGQFVVEVTASDNDSLDNGPPFKFWLPCSGRCPCWSFSSCQFFKFKFAPSLFFCSYSSVFISFFFVKNLAEAKFLLML